jgi:hypothetical protein
MIKLLTIAFLSSFLLVGGLGCAGKNCIKVGGTYQGIDGSVEYCYDSGASKEAGKTVLQGTDGASVVLSPKDVATVLKLVGTSEASAKLTGDYRLLIGLIKGVQSKGSAK